MCAKKKKKNAYVFDMSYETTFYLFVNLLFLGISCAPVFPASQVVLSRYTNTANRSIAMSIRSAGASIGAMVGTFLSPYFIYTIGWKNMLKLYGSFGLIVIAISFYYIQEEKKKIIIIMIITTMVSIRRKKRRTVVRKILWNKYIVIIQLQRKHTFNYCAINPFNQPIYAILQLI